MMFKTSIKYIIKDLPMVIREKVHNWSNEM